MGGTFKNSDIDAFNSQLPLPLVPADTIKLYKIKKIVQVKKKQNEYGKRHRSVV